MKELMDFAVLPLIVKRLHSCDRAKKYTSCRLNTRISDCLCCSGTESIGKTPSAHAPGVRWLLHKAETYFTSAVAGCPAFKGSIFLTHPSILYLNSLSLSFSAETTNAEFTTRGWMKRKNFSNSLSV